jgi:L-threonylcarbamoyladenylate synthase
VSPTTAAHVREDLGDAVDVLLDGGSCDVGVESTILDLTHDVPILLRPGGVTAERIESLLGGSVARHVPEGVRAPGMLESHYAPRARVELVDAAQLAERAARLTQQGERVAVLVSRGDDRSALLRVAASSVTLIDLGATDDDAAQRLYSALRQADVDNASVVLASRPVALGLGEALADRLAKAAGPRASES